MLKALATGALSYIAIVTLVKTKNSVRLSILALQHSFLHYWKELNASSRLTYIDFLESKKQNMKMKWEMFKKSAELMYMKPKGCKMLFVMKLLSFNEQTTGGRLQMLDSEQLNIC